MSLKKKFPSSQARKLGLEIMKEYDDSDFLFGPLPDQQKIIRLIKQGADLNVSKSFSLLHYAISYEDIAVIDAMLRYGADIHARDDVGNTPLMDAARMGLDDVLQLFLNNKVRVNDKTYRRTKDTPLDMYAIYLGNKGGDTALMKAASFGRMTCVRALIKAKADIHQKNNNGHTALTYAIAGGDEKIALLLLDQGGLANDCHDNFLGWTELMYAAHKGMDGVIKRLIAQGVRIDIKDKEGRTALDLAQQAKHTSTVKLLKNAVQLPHARIPQDLAKPRQKGPKKGVNPRI